MAESAAQHEAYYKAKMQEAQASYEVLVATGTLSCIKHKALCSTLGCICFPVMPCCICRYLLLHAAKCMVAVVCVCRGIFAALPPSVGAPVMLCKVVEDNCRLNCCAGFILHMLHVCHTLPTHALYPVYAAQCPVRKCLSCCNELRTAFQSSVLAAGSLHKTNAWVSSLWLTASIRCPGQAVWCCLQASIEEYVSSEAHKKERRDIDKQLTKVTQQISGTRYIVSLTHSATSSTSVY